MLWILCNETTGIQPTQNQATMPLAKYYQSKSLIFFFEYDALHYLHKINRSVIIPVHSANYSGNSRLFT